MRKVVVVAALLVLALPALAWGHIERPSYWPDPKADCSITPCTGGAVPTPRTLASALDAKAVGDTHVVCQGAVPDRKPVTAASRALARAQKRHAKARTLRTLRRRLLTAQKRYAKGVAANASIKALKASIADAVTHGYDIRPTDHQSYTAKQGASLLKLNEKLLALCSTDSIQAAVTAAHNNDRVVIMPGLYTEPASRAAKTNDPACSQYLGAGARGGNQGLSYTYQSHCPNDQNLIAVMGRAVGTGTDPNPPLEDRHGIPNAGPCIRCNLQVEGSGVSADDVVVDAGRVESGNKGPIGAVKDVGFRVDRADGFVLRNITVRHAKEHDIYVLESDGYLLDRFKVFYGGEYGVLTFVEDHGLIQNCDAAGSGDSGLYPGAGAPTGTTRDTKVYPDYRYSQEIRFCDSHHNVGGYSGTDGNSTWLHDNNFYDNDLGFTTDVFTAPGHPGFPQSSDLVEHNNFYSNNFNVYAKDSDVEPSLPEPVGTGMWIAGGNDNVVRYNHFYDNWRRGVMLFSVPDATVCGPTGTPVTNCDPTKVSTSYNNHFYGNVMGVSPDGKVMPNGTDFWWDSFPGNTGNCWWGNTAAPGKVVTSNQLVLPLPGCSEGKDPSTSIGTGDAVAESELLTCLATFTANGYDGTTCPWFTPPSKPTGQQVAQARTAAVRAREKSFMAFCQQTVASRTCAPFLRRLDHR